MSTSTVKAMRSREDEFMDRYQQLLKWAKKIPDSDRALAEDVVHEAFVQFMLSGTDYVSINNIDQYLREVLRNVHRTHLRQSTPRRFQQLSVITQNESQALLSDADPRKLFQARDALGAICLYARRRKDTSIASSVLILRFFHGYYPNEVAKLTRRSRNVVDVLLKAARRDLRDHFINPESGAPRREIKDFPPLSSQQPRLATDLTAELRGLIFAARRGQCFLPEQLAGVYAGDGSKVSRGALSHLVSCERCLDLANGILRLPPLRDRSPDDVLGKEPEVTQGE